MRGILGFLGQLCKSLVVISARSAIFGLPQTVHGSRLAGRHLLGGSHRIKARDAQRTDFENVRAVRGVTPAGAMRE